MLRNNLENMDKAKRTLTFADSVEEPSQNFKNSLAGCSFYLDIAQAQLMGRTRKRLEQLGAKTTTFLDKSVSYLITTTTKTSENEGTTTKADNNSSGGGVVTRAQLMLEKAPKTHSSKSSLLKKASAMGISVQPFDKFSRWMSKLEQLKRDAPTPLRQPFIKFEDSVKLYAPVFCEFPDFPTLDLSAASCAMGSSPFAFKLDSVRGARVTRNSSPTAAAAKSTILASSKRMSGTVQPGHRLHAKQQLAASKNGKTISDAASAAASRKLDSLIGCQEENFGRFLHRIQTRTSPRNARSSSSGRSCAGTSSPNGRDKAKSRSATLKTLNRRFSPPQSKSPSPPPLIATTPRKWQSNHSTLPKQSSITHNPPLSPAKLSLTEQTCLRVASPAKMALPQSPYKTPTKYPWMRVSDASTEMAHASPSNNPDSRSASNREYFSPISQYKLVMTNSSSKKLNSSANHLEANRAKRRRLNGTTKVLIGDLRVTVSRTSRVTTAGCKETAKTVTMPNYQTGRLAWFATGKRGPLTRCARIVPVGGSSAQKSTALRRSWRQLGKLIGRQLFTSPLTLVDADAQPASN